MRSTNFTIPEEQLNLLQQGLESPNAGGGRCAAAIEVMATRIIEFGDVPRGILAALAAKGYELNVCGMSTSKLRQALQQPDDLDAIALTENGAWKTVRILAPVHSDGKVPLILFQDESSTFDPSQFDLIVPENAPLPNLLAKVAALIERSRVIRAETARSGERLHTLLRQAASLCEQSVTASVEFQRIRRARRLSGSVTERVRIPCV